MIRCDVIMNGNIDQIYTEKYKYFYSIAYSILHNHSDAEDVVSESFLIYYEKGSDIRSEKVVNWLSTVISNKAKQYYNRNKKILPSDFFEEDNYLSDNFMFSSRQEDVEAIIIRNYDESYLIEVMIKELNELQILCVVGYYFSELSYEQIASIYDKSIGTIRSNLYRAKEKLRNTVVI